MWPGAGGAVPGEAGCMRKFVMEASLDQLSMLTADRLAEYEHDIGIVQATRNVNLNWVRQRDWLSEERRLMPEYVESFFLDSTVAVSR
jgi:hypothetical protein